MQNLIGILKNKTLFTLLFIVAATTAVTISTPQNTLAQTSLDVYGAGGGGGGGGLGGEKGAAGSNYYDGSTWHYGAAGSDSAGGNGGNGGNSADGTTGSTGNPGSVRNGGAGGNGAGGANGGNGGTIGTPTGGNGDNATSSTQTISSNTNYSSIHVGGGNGGDGGNGGNGGGNGYGYNNSITSYATSGTAGSNGGNGGNGASATLTIDANVKIDPANGAINIFGGNAGNGGNGGNKPGLAAGGKGGDGGNGGNAQMIINANRYVTASGSTVTIKGGNSGASGTQNGAPSIATGGTAGNARLDIYGYMDVKKTVIQNGSNGSATLQVHNGIHRSKEFDGISGTFQIDAGGMSILGLDENSWDSHATGANYQIETYGWVRHQLNVAGLPQNLANGGVLAWMDYAPKTFKGGKTLDLSKVSLGVGTTAVAPGSNGAFGSNSLTVVNSPGYINDNTKIAIKINAGNGSLTGGNPFAAGSDDAKLLVVVDQNIKTGDKFIVMQNTGGNFNLANGSTNLGWTNANNAFTTSRLLSVKVEVDTTDNKNLVATFDKKDPVLELPGLSESVGGLLTATADQVGHSNGWNPDPSVLSTQHSGVHYVSRISDTVYMPDANLGARTLENSVRLASSAGTQAATISLHIASAKTVHVRATDLVPGMGSGSSFLANFDNGINYLSANGSKRNAMPNYVSFMFNNYENTVKEQKKSLANGYGNDVTLGRAYNSGLGIWAMPIYQNTSVKKLTAGNFKAGFDGHFYGIVVGGDYTTDTTNKLRIGVSFDMGTGKADSNGAFIDTKNDFDYWGATIYGGYNIGNFILSADFNYNRTKNKITQRPPASLLFPDLKAKVNNDIWSFGVKAQYKHQTPVVDITPYAAARFMSVKTGNYKVLTNTYYSPGSTGVVFAVKEDTQNVWRFPVGVQFSKDVNVNNDMILVPSFDIGAIFAAGDLDSKSVTRIPGVNATSVTTMDNVIDSVTFDAKAGIELFTGSGISIGAGYNLQLSEHRTGHTIFGTVRFEF